MMCTYAAETSEPCGQCGYRGSNALFSSLRLDIYLLIVVFSIARSVDFKSIHASTLFTCLHLSSSDPSLLHLYFFFLPILFLSSFFLASLIQSHPHAHTACPSFPASEDQILSYKNEKTPNRKCRQGRSSIALLRGYRCKIDTPSDRTFRTHIRKTQRAIGLWNMSTLFTIPLKFVLRRYPR